MLHYLHGHTSEISGCGLILSTPGTKRERERANGDWRPVFGNCRTLEKSERRVIDFFTCSHHIVPHGMR